MNEDNDLNVKIERVYRVSCVWPSLNVKGDLLQIVHLLVTMFGHLILISIDFYDFVSLVVSIVLAAIKKTYQILKTVIDFISKH